MLEVFSSLGGVAGYFAACVITLILAIFISLYFAKLFKDEAELEDEGLGADEVRLEDDPRIQEQLRARLQSEIDDDEAYEEDEETLSDSDNEHVTDIAAKPSHHYNHILGKFKAKRYKNKLERNLTPEQIEEERRIEREQLAAIFELLRKQEAELNLRGMSDRDLKEQVRLYR